MSNLPETLPEGVFPDRVKALEEGISRQEQVVATKTVIYRRAQEHSDSIPGAFNAGGSKYRLGNKRQAATDRLQKAWNEKKEAEEELHRQRLKLKGYLSGNFHENGQPRANGPARKAAANAEASYGDYLRAILKPGDRVTFVPNPNPEGCVVVKVNKKTVSLAGMSNWEFTCVLPWKDGKPQELKEVMLDYKRWKASQPT